MGPHRGDKFPTGCLSPDRDHDCQSRTFPFSRARNEASPQTGIIRPIRHPSLAFWISRCLHRWHSICHRELYLGISDQRPGPLFRREEM